MKKRLLALCLLLTIVINGCGNTSQSGESQISDGQGNANELIEIIWWTYTPDGKAPDDAEEVLKRANEISAEKIGVTAKMIYKTEEQFDLDLQTGATISIEMQVRGTLQTLQIK